MCAKRYRYKHRNVARRAAELLALKLQQAVMKVYRCPQCQL